MSDDETLKQVIRDILKDSTEQKDPRHNGIIWLSIIVRDHRLERLKELVKK